MRISLFFVILLMFACQQSNTTDMNETVDLELAKSEILDCLNNETKAAFQRNFEDWKSYWIHKDYSSKTYLNYVDSTFSETLGWEEISGFVENFILENPSPDVVPAPLENINLQLYGNGAFVYYNQLDPKRGKKRETRLMEKDQGKWKIASMTTTIYGFGKDERD